MNDKNKNAVALYDRIAERYAKNFDNAGTESGVLFLNAFLAHLKHHAHIVDLGCGTGFSAD